MQGKNNALFHSYIYSIGGIEKFIVKIKIYFFYILNKQLDSVLNIILLNFV